MPTAMIVEPTMNVNCERIRLRYQYENVLSAVVFEAKDSHQCTFSFIPFLTKSFLAADAKQSLDPLSEDDGTLCHYFYFPMADPSASKKLTG